MQKLKNLFKFSGFKVALIPILFMAGLYLWNLVNLSSISFFELMDKKIIDRIQQTRGIQEHGDEVVVIAIDTKSVDQYGRWPWPRSIMAKMVNVLENHYKISTIGFDIVFSEPDSALGTADNILKSFTHVLKKDRSFSRTQLKKKVNQLNLRFNNEFNYDTKFGAELSKWDNIVLGYLFFNDPDAVAHMTKEEIKKATASISGSEIKIIQGAQYLDRALIYEGRVVEGNIPSIATTKSLAGFFNMIPDQEDGMVRRVHLVWKHDGHYYPSLDLQVLRTYLGSPNLRMVVNEAGVQGIFIGKNFVPTDSSGGVMLNYRGPVYTYKHYSIYDVIEKKIPLEKLKGKIALIGATEAGIFDLRTTPVGVAYPGIEVHATLLDNIIRGDYFYQDDLVKLYSLLVILGVGLLLGLVLPRLGALAGAFFSLTLLLVYFSINYWAVNKYNTWTSFVYVIFEIVLIWSLVTIYRFFIEEKDKRFIKTAFQHFLSPVVINQLCENPGLLKLGGERKHMTAFFSDIQGFSTISESLEPEELVELLNDYLTEMTDIIMKYGGTVDKFEGDAIIAFFGAPINYKDHAKRACLASLEMQAKLAEMREVWRKEGKHELFMRIGLNTGDMVVGNMGSKTRMDYTMMGDSVNLAARLEGVNKQYGTFTMFSQFTYEDVQGSIETRELDLIRVVGKNEPVRIYEVCGEKGCLTGKQKDAYKYFAKGLQYYRVQEWKEAIKYFHQVAKLIPDDGPTRTYLKRCTYFATNPPAMGWDGVFQMKSK